MEIMNRAAGMADEMGTFVHAYLKEFENAVRAGVINEMRYIVIFWNK